MVIPRNNLTGIHTERHVWDNSAIGQLGHLPERGLIVFDGLHTVRNIPVHERAAYRCWPTASVTLDEQTREYRQFRTACIIDRLGALASRLDCPKPVFHTLARIMADLAKSMHDGNSSGTHALRKLGDQLPENGFGIFLAEAAYVANRAETYLSTLWMMLSPDPALRLIYAILGSRPDFFESRAPAPGEVVEPNTLYTLSSRRIMQPLLNKLDACDDVAAVCKHLSQFTAFLKLEIPLPPGTLTIADWAASATLIAEALRDAWAVKAAQTPAARPPGLDAVLANIGNP